MSGASGRHAGESTAPVQMKGDEKAAAVLLAMGKPAAARLLKYFGDSDLRAVTRAAAALGAIPAPAIDHLVGEIVARLSIGPELSGSAGMAAALLDGALPPEQVAEIMADITGSENRSNWARLSSVPSNVFAAFLSKEHPQAAALVLTRISSDLAAELMKNLPAADRADIVQRILNCRPVGDAAVKLLETAMMQELFSVAPQSDSDKQTARAADIINKMDRAESDEILQDLSATRPGDALAIKALLFDFSDIAGMAQSQHAILFDQIPTEKVVLALKDASGELRQIVLAALAPRARRIAESELASGEPAPQRDIAQAQRDIADAALAMSRRGQIELRAQAAADA